MPPLGFKKRQGLHLSPPQTITLSFACMILAGAALLNLPFASQNGQSIGFLNALFTATSANCVTGLVVVNTLEHWTVFGKVVILALIQLGGLGLISVLTVGMVWLRKSISLPNRILVQTAFNQDNIGGMVRLVRKVLQVTLLFESIGALLLTFGFFFSAPRMPFGEALAKGVFHSISAFCNAGFDIIGPDSLTPYQSNYYINFVIIALLVAGGLGFTVWGEWFTKPKDKPARTLGQKWLFLSLHSKIAILVTGGLLLSGTGLFLLFEWGNPETFGPLSPPQKMLAAFFQSATLRTCGFNSVNQGRLTEPSQLLSCLYMFIGGSPASTAGGIKTVTLGIVGISMLSALRGKNKLEAFERTLPLDLLQKALAVVSTLFIVVLASTLILYFTEMDSVFKHSILDLLFESVSAAGTVGVSTGITPYLSSAGKIVLSIGMFLGRLGPVTVVVALNMRLHKNAEGVSYPHERVIIG